MAFPTTGVLDTFDRANGGLGSNWSDEPFNDSVGGSFAIFSNRIDIATGVYCSAWYNAATYGPDTEVYIDVDVASNNFTWLTLWLRISSPSASASTGDGYGVEISWDGNLAFYRMDNGVSTDLGDQAVSALSDGDGFGASMIGSTLQAYRRQSGVWSTFGTPVVDSTYSAGGYLGISSYDAAGAAFYNNFGGGTVVPATSTLRSLMLTGVGT